MRSGRIRILGVPIVLTIAVVAGYLAGACVTEAKAQVQPPSHDWVSIGEINGVSVFMLNERKVLCYLTTPSGSITCVK